MPLITPIPNLASAGVEVPLSLTEEQRQALIILIDTARYVANRLVAESTTGYSQSASDLNIALAQVRYRMTP